VNSHPVYLLAPVFDFLDRILHEHGDTFFILFVYLAFPLVTWILGRRSGRKKLNTSHRFILVIKPPAQSTEYRR
jgi:hypothetical protein